MTTASRTYQRRTRSRWLPGVVLVLAIAVVVAVTSASGESRFTASGDSYPGTFTSVAYVLLRFIAALSGAMALGQLVFALTCTRFGRDGRVGPAGYAALTTAGRAATVWLASAVVLVPISATDATGIGIGEAVQRGVIADLIPPNEAPKAWMVSAIAAALVSIGTRFTLNWVPMAVTAAIAAIGILPAWVIGNAGQGPKNDIVTSAIILAILALSIWTGSTIGLRTAIRREGGQATDTAVAVTRYSMTALCAALLTVGLSAGGRIVLAGVAVGQVAMAGPSRAPTGADRGAATARGRRSVDANQQPHFPRLACLPRVDSQPTSSFSYTPPPRRVDCSIQLTMNTEIDVLSLSWMYSPTHRS